VSACNAASCTGTGFARLDMAYDALGHRLTLTETPAAGPATVTAFTYAGDAVVRETSTTGTTTVTRTFTTGATRSVWPGRPVGGYRPPG
jgi:hypothetical protein